MRFALSVALLALPATALAEDGGTTVTQHGRDTNKAVIGGAQATIGEWPDAAAILWGGQQECTGTLVAPTVVITAGHCVIDGWPDHVLLNAVSKSNPQGGESLWVDKAIEYPGSQGSVDGAIILLQTPATTPPRAIASGWAAYDIKNGADVQLVGFGTIDRDGNVETDSLMEAPSTITDFNCSTKSGCNSAARPNGELGAGGMGIDTCPGDSGGPLYLKTSYGNFVAGITSRGYDTNRYYCSEGGIYARPDKIIDWIEEQAKVKVTRGPGPTAEDIKVVRGTPAEVQLAVNDPYADRDHTFEILAQPGYGKAAVSSTGIVRVCAQKDVEGDDALTVGVTDASDSMRTTSVKIPIHIADGSPDSSCDENAFGDDGGGGCNAGRRTTGSLPLALLVGLVIRRRRRQSR